MVSIADQNVNVAFFLRRERATPPKRTFRCRDWYPLVTGRVVYLWSIPAADCHHVVSGLILRNDTKHALGWSRGIRPVYVGSRRVRAYRTIVAIEPTVFVSRFGVRYAAPGRYWHEAVLLPRYRWGRRQFWEAVALAEEVSKW